MLNNLWKFAFGILIVLLLQSCATPRETQTATVPKEGPSISPTIKEEEQHVLKRKVAIARFSNETKYGQGFFYDANDDRLGKQAMDIFSAKLTATGKFIMLERSDLNKLATERELGNLQAENISADYLILGSVTEFGRKTTSEVGVFSRTKTQTAYANVSIRLVDSRTGQIIYSEEGKGEAFTEAGTTLGFGDRAEYDATLNDKVISAAISNVVNNIVENLLEKPWRAYILAEEGGSYFISGGALQGIKAGDEFAVLERGKKVNNPQSGISIELPAKEVGRIRVESVIPGDVTTELSICKKVSGEVPSSDFGNIIVGEIMK